MQPVAPVTLPGTDSWVERYGPIGFIAALALFALWVGIQRYVREAADKQKALEAMLSAQREAVDALQTRLVETVQRNHSDTLDLLAEQRREAEQRYQLLLDRHMALSDVAREKMGELAATVTAALQALARKTNGNGHAPPQERS